MPLAVDVFWSFRSPVLLPRHAAAGAPGGRVRRRRARAGRAADRRPHRRILRDGEPALAAVSAARHDADRGVRAHSVRLAAARPDRAGLPDAEGRGRAALHPSTDAPRRRGAASAGAAFPSSPRCRASSGAATSSAGTKARISPRPRRAPGSTWPSWTRRSRRTRDRHDAVIAENQHALEAAGHWGVPTMVFAGEPFFGQDRIELLVWRMQQHGLSRRAT